MTSCLIWYPEPACQNAGGQSTVLLLKQLDKGGKIRKVNPETMALLMSLIGIGYMTLFETGDRDLTQIPLKKLTDDFAQILVNGLTPEK